MGAVATGIGQGVGQGVGLAKDIFGSKQSQDVAGSQRTAFTAQDEARLRQQADAYSKDVGGYQKLLSQLQGQAASPAPQLQTNLGLNTSFTMPKFGGGLDTESQSLLGLVQQQQANQLQAQQNQLRSQLRNNPILASLMGSQLGTQAQLAQNPLLFQAQQAQDVRNIGRAQAQNEAQQLGNAALQAQGQFGNQAMLGQFGLGQQQRAEQAGFGQQGVSASASLFDMLQKLGQQFGTTYQNQSSSGRSGGLF